MELTFVSSGKRLGLHPDSEQAVLDMPVWQRHAAYHDMCRKFYAMANPFKPLAPALPREGDRTLTSREQWILDGNILP